MKSCAHQYKMILFLLCFISLLAQGSRATSCYFPDGNLTTTEANDWSPCDPTAQVSTCCQSTHVCLSNNLCFDNIFNHVLRGGCTNPSFPSPDCPQYCLDSPGDGLADMRQCNGQNNYWSCSMDCDCNGGFTVFPGYVADKRAGVHGVTQNGTAATSSSATESSSSAASTTS
jgi:hypothetical protein